MGQPLRPRKIMALIPKRNSTDDGDPLGAWFVVPYFIKRTCLFLSRPQIQLPRVRFITIPASTLGFCRQSLTIRVM
jgi:hypothetical protein